MDKAAVWGEKSVKTQYNELTLTKSLRRGRIPTFYLSPLLFTQLSGLILT